MWKNNGPQLVNEDDPRINTNKSCAISKSTWPDELLQTQRPQWRHGACRPETRNSAATSVEQTNNKNLNMPYRYNVKLAYRLGPGLPSGMTHEQTLS